MNLYRLAYHSTFPGGYSVIDGDEQLLLTHEQQFDHDHFQEMVLSVIPEAYRLALSFAKTSHPEQEAVYWSALMSHVADQLFEQYEFAVLPKPLVDFVVEHTRLSSPHVFDARDVFDHADHRRAQAIADTLVKAKYITPEERQPPRMGDRLAEQQVLGNTEKISWFRR